MGRSTPKGGNMIKRILMLGVAVVALAMVAPAIGVGGLSYGGGVAHAQDQTDPDTPDQTDDPSDTAPDDTGGDSDGDSGGDSGGDPGGDSGGDAEDGPCP